MMKKDIIIVVLIFVLTLSLLLSFHYEDSRRAASYENGFFSVHWCISENCTRIIVEQLSRSDDIKCAFYTLRHRSLISVLEEKDAGIVLHEKTNTVLDGNANIRTVMAPRLWGLMHNKFCTYTLNGQRMLITGSYNPSGNEKKHDLLFIISSDSLADEYEREHHEMSNGIFAGGKRRELKELHFTTSDGNQEFLIMIRPFFCPEDGCEKSIIEEIKRSEREIVIAAYTYTSLPITEAVISAVERGVNVTMIMDRGTRNVQGSQVPRLEEYGIPMRIAPDYLMHHKIMIIDDTIIMGSMNYGKNADTRNDENILIIDDQTGLLKSHIYEQMMMI